MGGDFNITRFVSEGRGEDRSSNDREKFNDFINHLDVIDIDGSNVYMVEHEAQSGHG